MAYLGTTSTAPNVPALVTQSLAYSSSNVTGVAGLSYGLPRVWIYSSTHLAVDVSSADFFGKDPSRLGMKVGDVLWHFGSSNPAIHMCINAGATTSDFGTQSTAPGSTA